MSSIEPTRWDWERGPDGRLRKKPWDTTRWRVLYRVANGERRSQKFDTRAAAELFAAKREGR